MHHELWRGLSGPVESSLGSMSASHYDETICITFRFLPSSISATEWKWLDTLKSVSKWWDIDANKSYWMQKFMLCSWHFSKPHNVSLFHLLVSSLQIASTSTRWRTKMAAAQIFGGLKTTTNATWQVSVLTLNVSFWHFSSSQDSHMVPPPQTKKCWLMWTEDSSLFFTVLLKFLQSSYFVKKPTFRKNYTLKWGDCKLSVFQNFFIIPPILAHMLDSWCPAIISMNWILQNKQWWKVNHFCVVHANYEQGHSLSAPPQQH